MGNAAPIHHHLVKVHPTKQMSSSIRGLNMKR